MKFNELPFIPKKETIFHVKNAIEYVQDRLQVFPFFNNLLKSFSRSKYDDTDGEKDEFYHFL